MDNKLLSIHWLKELEARRNALENNREVIAYIDAELQSYKAVCGKEPVQGGSSMQEEKMLNLICEKQQLEWSYQAAELIVPQIEEALRSLGDRERKTLERFFVSPVKKAHDILCEEFGVEKSTVYRIKDRALREFTLAVCGVENL